MASKYERKLILGFKFFDLDRDGLVSKKDMTKFADVICSLTNASPEETEITRNEWVKWCDALYPEGETAVGEEEWVSSILKFRSEHCDELKAGDTATYGNLFDRVDLNKDGMISREELGIYYQAFGVTDKKFTEKVFRQLDLNEDGYVTREEFVRAGVNYWSTDAEYEFFYDAPDS